MIYDMKENVRRLIRALNNIDEVYDLNEAKKKPYDAEIRGMLTDAGQSYTKQFLSVLYRAEDQAFQKTHKSIQMALLK